MRRSAVPVTDREAKQFSWPTCCWHGWKKKSVCWASAASLERRCAAIGSLETHLLNHKIWDEAEKKTQLTFSHQAWLPISCHFLTTRLAFASSQWVLYNCQMTCLSKHFSCRLVIFLFLLFFWVTGSRVWSHRALHNVVRSCVGRTLWILDILR